MSRHLLLRPLLRSYSSSTRKPPTPLPTTSTQAYPLTGFYADLLLYPLTPANALPPGARVITPASAADPAVPATEPFSPHEPSTPPEQQEREARARVVFGSRLAGPGDDEARLKDKQTRGQMIAGVWVPPKPVEPDNCCMSGCVNCVLSAFVEDLDEWRRAKRRAEERLKLTERGGEDAADAGEVEGLWDGFEDIPVGLRVFMETEKRLKGKA
ncbi:oxidoreductase-like protein [Tricharina praecox]|uniref:oxidoreductase-like protein n=1 Tax=Tricharina praecox TaxID=43433 RepID=UPI002220CDE5|nr:oxidoreductase-like protein [Tricharina praecox]KAI5844737.1 oxidoreductase-like protein [Tricharina praecox]